MTAEQRWILDLTEILTLRLECSRCGTAVVCKLAQWRDAPGQCPACESYWDLPRVAGEQESGLQHLGVGLKLLLEHESAAGKTGKELPYRVKFEIRDPATSKFGL